MGSIAHMDPKPPSSPSSGCYISRQSPPTHSSIGQNGVLKLGKPGPPLALIKEISVKLQYTNLRQW